MARRVTARWDTMTTTMATGDDKDDNDDGDGAAGDKVDNDGNNENYGDGPQRQLWQRSDGQRRNRIRQ